MAMEVDLGGATIGALFDWRACTSPDATFAIFPGQELTYGEVAEQARRFAKGLVHLGVKPGEHVAILMPTCADWLIAYFGAFYAGAVVVALNARYKRQELSYTLEQSDAAVLVTTDAISDHVDFAELISQTFPDLGNQADERSLNLESVPKLRSLVLFGATDLPGFLSRDELDALGGAVSRTELDTRLCAADANSPAVLMYTSGTTSKPKACVLTHAGIGRSWRTFAEVVALSAGESVWLPMPFFHTGGIGPMSAIIWRGAALVAQTHFDADGIVELIARHRIEHLYSGFPQFSLTILQHEKFSREESGFVRSMLNVGPPAMQRKIQGLLPSNAKILNLFGMTEGSGIITFTPWNSTLDVRAQTSGCAPEHTQVRIMHPETGEPVATGEAGEIQFRGGGAFSHYYKDMKATEETIIEGGWIRTGDRGKLDDEGWLYYLGRLKDMLKVGGENVAASEIEFFLSQHPQVKMVQVIGAYDKRLDEVPVAFVERTPGATVTAEELIAMCQGELARWKIPRDVVFVRDWPMSSTKIQKFRLRELLPKRFRELA